MFYCRAEVLFHDKYKAGPIPHQPIRFRWRLRGTIDKRDHPDGPQGAPKTDHSDIHQGLTSPDESF